jgi:hypothetical protein
MSDDEARKCCPKGRKALKPCLRMAERPNLPRA